MPQREVIASMFPTRSCVQAARDAAPCACISTFHSDSAFPSYIQRCASAHVRRDLRKTLPSGTHPFSKLRHACRSRVIFPLRVTHAVRPRLMFHPSSPARCPCLRPWHSRRNACRSSRKPVPTQIAGAAPGARISVLRKWSQNSSLAAVDL